MQKLTKLQLAAKLNSKAVKATEEQENALAVDWAFKAQSKSNPHGAVTAQLESMASTGYVHEGVRYYAARVAAKAHKMLG